MPLLRTIDLREYTTWAIGGPCRAAFPENIDALAQTVTALEGEGVPWTVLGKGSNTLAPSSGWQGVAVILSGEFNRWGFRHGDLTAGAGAPLPSMAGSACRTGLAGLVFAVGIPGTAGGAVYMNAGAYGSSISELVTGVQTLSPSGEVRTLSREECGFAYRTSGFQSSRDVIVSVGLRLHAAHSFEETVSAARGVLRLRREKFPLSLPNAGSVFKRPLNGPPPGKLIEDCGLKGFSVGAAQVSSIHANFIVNRGGATSDQVLQLMDTVRARVFQTTGIELQREIRVLGED